MTLLALVTVLVGIFGLLVCSFLYVVVYRVPLGLSIVAPPSACPRCGAGIKPYDNIPVLSWLLLRGRCRSCTTGISVRYPLVEAGTGLFFAAGAWVVGAGRLVSTSSTTGIASTTGLASTTGTGLTVTILLLTAFLYLAAVSVALALIDLDVHRLPDAIVLPSYVVGSVLLTAAAIVGGDFEALLRAAIGLGALWLAYFLMALAYPGGMGLGDVKLAGVLGLFLGYLGWGPLLVGAFSAFVLGGVFSVALIVLGHATRKSGIPFGPWMLVGAWVGIFFGSSIWNGYLSLLGVS